MKKLILLFAFTLLIATLTSCTADELPTQQEQPLENSQSTDIVPPIVIKP